MLRTALYKLWQAAQGHLLDEEVHMKTLIRRKKENS